MNNNITISEMLNYYGYNNLSDFGKAYGLYVVKDSERLLREMYEEDILTD
jgi:hypothetical protein